VKVVTLLGTRPEIIRLSRIIPKLDALCEHVLVNTGQNFDPKLSDVFFEQLGVRAADRFLNAKGATAFEQIGKILTGVEAFLQEIRPDRLLILGDTNSGLSAVVAKRMGIPVFHMEAGNRCFDDRVPEEVNRRVIDHSSDVLMPYTERSRANLLREGIASDRIFVTGNPILEVIQHHDAAIARSRILEELEVDAGGYFLVTLHRAENVDLEARLRAFVEALADLAATYDLPVIVSTHPRLRHHIEKSGLVESGRVRFLPPFGFFDFVHLEKRAKCVLSDSGTVQEECAIFGMPNVTLRDVTERPETLECGSNILSGDEPASIMRAVRLVLQGDVTWHAPPEYMVKNVSDTVVRIVTGYNRHFEA
jgi:UDP-N-acetylglucosamine 2-epimerase (non-hydrolysing)